jgi:hypothetical protein
MRSEQIHRALAQGYNRFEICKLVSKGVKVTHRPGARFEDSIGNVLDQIKLSGKRHATPSQPENEVIDPAA